MNGIPRRLAGAQRSEWLRSRAEQALPPGSRRRGLARVGLQLAHDARRYLARLRLLWAMGRQRSPRDPDYADWLTDHRSSVQNLLNQRTFLEHHPIPVGVRILVSAPAPGLGLDETLRSLEYQTFSDWSATVVGPGAVDAPHDPRLAALSVPAAAIGDELARLAGETADPDFVLFVEAGDVLEPDLAFHLAAHAWQDPLVELVHWDDDELDDDLRPRDPRMRPEWSPEMLLSANYLGRSYAVRGRRLRRAGGLQPTGDDSRWWDLLLRLDLEADQVRRIPRVLAHVHRRPAPSARESVELVRRHLVDRGDRVAVDWGGQGVHVRHQPAESPHVTVIIPTRHNREMLSVSLPSLATTDYPSFDVVIVDNGGRAREHEAWYEQASWDLDLEVHWWSEPFNYSAVNNHAAAFARGEVLVFLNDDTEILDPSWLHELVGWATRPEIGVTGLQLIGPDDEIQHGGVVLGMHGFAEHLFAGLDPHSDTLMGPTGWTRNTLAVTAACLAIERGLFEQIGGFDERFVLCGSDVVLGLDAVAAGRRNVCSPFTPVRHLESATRGRTVPREDFFASYWRYQKWIFGGDPYYSPNLSLESRIPRLRALDESTPGERISGPLDRSFTVFRQKNEEAESRWLADTCRADDELVEQVAALHASSQGRIEPRTVTWFVPDIDSPFYGGINTALRMADHLARHHGVRNQFAVMATPNEAFFRSALAAAFPALADAPIGFHDGSMTRESLDGLPPADVAIATLWVTAYAVARFPHARRKFYLVQDFEPMFYPASTLYALAEESYRLGLYGLCNTERLLDIYQGRYGGTGAAFVPAVDDRVFHAEGRTPLTHDGPATVFVYARPGHWRNCWELASLALADLKDRLGDGVRIVTAGSWARPDDLGRGIEHLGLLDYRDTGALYRTCDVGVALTVSEHPSYLPLELMACGVPVVAFDNPAGDWILHHEENSLRCRRTVDGLADALERLALDGELRDRLAKQGLADIAEHHASWERAFAGIFDHLADPERPGPGS